MKGVFELIILDMLVSIKIRRLFLPFFRLENGHTRCLFENLSN